MYKSMSSFAGFKLKALLIAASAALLAGCTSDGANFDDQYVPSTHYERFPIKVAKAPMRLEVKPRGNGLQPAQINAVSNFARSAAEGGVTRISLSRPSGGGASSAVASQIRELLVTGGVPSSQISQVTYRGSSKSPVILAFTRAVAVTKECGDWSTDLNHSPDNAPYPNHGCAVQNNIAAMVQDPTDFEVPTPTSPVDAATRIELKKLFVKID
jgi:pilus assembly protein CpaD